LNAPLAECVNSEVSRRCHVGVRAEYDLDRDGVIGASDVLLAQSTAAAAALPAGWISAPGPAGGPDSMVDNDPTKFTGNTTAAMRSTLGRNLTAVPIVAMDIATALRWFRGLERGQALCGQGGRLAGAAQLQGRRPRGDPLAAPRRSALPGQARRGGCSAS